MIQSPRNMSVQPEQLRHRESNSHISPEELAAYWHVHVHTIYRDIRKGALRAFKLPSGRLRIRPDDARRYGRPIE